MPDLENLSLDGKKYLDISCQFGILFFSFLGSDKVPEALQGNDFTLTL